MSSGFLRFDFPTFRAVLRKTVNRRVGKAAVALILAALAVHASLLVVWGRALEHKIESIRAGGRPIMPVDLAPKPVPAAANGAVIYQRIFDRLRKDEAQAARADTIALWIVENDKKHDQAALTAEYRKWMGGNQAIFDLLDKAVSAPTCQFPVKLEQAYAALFPHFAPIRNLTRLAAARSVVEARNGNVEAALNDSALALKIGLAIKNEPSIISPLIRVASSRTALCGLKESTRDLSLTPEQSRGVYDELDSISFTESFVLGLEGERANLNWAFDKLRADLSYAYYLGSTEPLGDKRLLRLRLKAVQYLWRPLSYKDQLTYLNVVDEQLKRARLPYRMIVRSQPQGGQETRSRTLTSRVAGWIFLPALFGFQDEATTVPSDVRIPDYALLTQLLAPVYLRMFASRDSAMAEIGMAQVAMALKAYKSRFHAYPSCLAELRAQLRWRLPDDPFTGKPYEYKRTGSGFTLYSWGDDLKDDHGRQKDNSGTGDLVWSSNV